MLYKYSGYSASLQNNRFSQGFQAGLFLLIFILEAFILSSDLSNIAEIGNPVSMDGSGPFCYFDISPHDTRDSKDFFSGESGHLSGTPTGVKQTRLYLSGIFKISCDT